MSDGKICPAVSSLHRDADSVRSAAASWTAVGRGCHDCRSPRAPPVAAPSPTRTRATTMARRLPETGASGSTPARSAGVSCTPTHYGSALADDAAVAEVRDAFRRDAQAGQDLASVLAE